jgi:hypothetical protein
MKFPAAADAYPIGWPLFVVGFVVFLPPLQSTSVAAKPTIGAHAPIHGELFTAVGANLRRTLYAALAFLLFLSMIHNAAAVTAKPPSLAALPGLFDVLAAFRTGIYRDGVIPFCIVVFDTAFSAAVFLPRFVATRLERLTAAQAGQFFTHNDSPAKLKLSFAAQFLF